MYDRANGLASRPSPRCPSLAFEIGMDEKAAFAYFLCYDNAAAPSLSNQNNNNKNMGAGNTLDKSVSLATAGCQSGNDKSAISRWVPLCIRLK